MNTSLSAARWIVGAAALGLGVMAAATGGAQGQAPAAAPQAPAPTFGGGGGRGGGLATALYGAIDANKDGCATRAELKSAFEAWFADADSAKAGAITSAQLQGTLDKAFAPAAPAANAAAGGGGGRGGAQNQTPVPCDVDLMTSALPSKAPAKPAKPRKVLVLAKSAGFVHSSIPLAAKTVEALGAKTGAFTATISYDPKDITAENLKQYDAILLDSTTGCFLDDPNDAAATEARRKALLEFVRGGKGLAGLHAATDSYHPGNLSPCNPRRGGGGGGFGGGGGARGGGGRGATGAPAAPAAPTPSSAETLTALMMAQGDKNADQKLSKPEITALADAWFDKLDTDKATKVRRAEFSGRFSAINPAPPTAAGAGGGRRGGDAAPVARGSVDPGEGYWPEFNKLIGATFKSHWNDPQLITVKIDDPKSPLTAMFHGKEFDIHDETYTFRQNSFSRDNVHVLTSIDYDKMSAADKAEESNGTARTDGDYALSWIRREGQGRVFYEAHGHSERIYAMTPMLEHLLAGIQYALGDLKADDAPSGYGRK